MQKGTYPGVDNLEVLREAENYNNFLRDEVFRNGRAATAILDFGAGIGTFPVALRDMGLQVVCVEPEKDMLDRLRSLGFKGYSSLKEIAPESFDFIYSLNVLEHIEDDLQTLRDLYRSLRPGGRLFLYVPAFNFLYSSMDRKVGHFRRYKKRGLTELMRRTGFEVEHAVYADSLGFFVTLVYKLIGNKSGDLNRPMVKLYDTAIFPVSRLLDRVIGGIFGKNLMIRSRRPTR